MTFLEFKKALSSVMKGDKDIKTDSSQNDTLFPVLNDAIRAVAIEAGSLLLMTNDITKDVLEVQEDGYFIRTPKVIENDDDILEIDTILEFAVVYEVATVLGTNKAIYKSFKDEKINAFKWSLFKAVGDM